MHYFLSIELKQMKSTWKSWNAKTGTKISSKAHDIATNFTLVSSRYVSFMVLVNIMYKSWKECIFSHHSDILRIVSILWEVATQGI